MRIGNRGLGEFGFGSILGFFAYCRWRVVCIPPKPPTSFLLPWEVLFLSILGSLSHSPSRSTPYALRRVRRFVGSRPDAGLFSLRCRTISSPCFGLNPCFVLSKRDETFSAYVVPILFCFRQANKYSVGKLMEKSRTVRPPVRLTWKEMMKHTPSLLHQEGE